MWTLHETVNIPVWLASSAHGTTLAFSTRRGGVSTPPYDDLNLGRSTADRPESVRENRNRFLTSLQLESERLATAGQVHGDRIAEAAEPGHIPDCDALVTRRTGLALAVSGADCMPLLFEAPGVIAAAHAGWRGMAAELPRKTIECLVKEHGADLADIRVHMGPCIRACCYEVGPEVAARFPAVAVQSKGDTVHLNLATAARVQLLATGVPDTSVHDTLACTSCVSDWYFSHRRDAGRTGRQWGLAALADPDC